MAAEAAEIDKELERTLMQLDAVAKKCTLIVAEGIHKNKTWVSQRRALWRQSGNIVRKLAAARAPSYPSAAARSGAKHPGRRGNLPHKPGHLRKQSAYAQSVDDQSTVIKARKFKAKRGFVGSQAAAAAWYSQFKTAGIVRKAGGGSERRSDVADDFLQQSQQQAIRPAGIIWAKATGSQLATDFTKAARDALRSGRMPTKT